MGPRSGAGRGRRGVTLPLAIRYALVLLLAACAAPSSDYTPPIAISPGVEGRLAMMDRYRLHDEERRLMMERPRVWVEGVPDDDDADAGATEDPDASIVHVSPGVIR